MPLSKISIFVCASFPLISLRSSAMDLSIIGNNTQASSSHNTSSLENKESVSAFFREVAAGNDIACCFLLEAGVSVHTRDEKGRTALMIAAFHGHVALCKLLIQNGAIIDAKDPRGESASSLTSNAEIKKLLSHLGPLEPKRKLSSQETEPE